MKKAILILMAVAVLVLSSCAKTQYVCPDGSTVEDTSMCVSAEDFGINAFWRSTNPVCNDDVKSRGTAELSFAFSKTKNFNNGCDISVDGTKVDSNFNGYNDIREVDSAYLGRFDANLPHTVKICCRHLPEGIFETKEYCKEKTTEKLCEGQTNKQESLREYGKSCDGDIGLKFIEFDDVKQVCVNVTTDTLDFTIQNSGTVDFEGVKVEAIGGSTTSEKNIIKSLPSSGILKDQIPYSLIDNGVLDRVRITPIIKINGEKVICEYQPLMKEGIGVCG